MTAHTVYCRGCQHAWIEDDSLPHDQVLMADLLSNCSCSCTDPDDPRYEDWTVDPDPEDIPAAAWE